MTPGCEEPTHRAAVSIEVAKGPFALRGSPTSPINENIAIRKARYLVSVS